MSALSASINDSRKYCFGFMFQGFRVSAFQGYRVTESTSLQLNDH
jgi:hypothetical protein